MQNYSARPFQAHDARIIMNLLCKLDFQNFSSTLSCQTEQQLRAQISFCLFSSPSHAYVKFPCT